RHERSESVQPLARQDEARRNGLSSGDFATDCRADAEAMPAPSIRHEAGPVPLESGLAEPRLPIPSLPAQFELDDEMRDAFLADASDLGEKIGSLIPGLIDRQDPRGVIQELSRCFHTIKGAASSVGMTELAAVVHEVEGRLAHPEDDSPAALQILVGQF